MIVRESNCSPAVSVIMPAYNCEKYIEAAIRSVVSQTFTDWELIVLDDGSSDSTREIIDRLAAEDDRIVPMPNERNMGVAKTLLFGMKNGSNSLWRMTDDIRRNAISTIKAVRV